MLQVPSSFSSAFAAVVAVAAVVVAAVAVVVAAAGKSDIAMEACLPCYLTVRWNSAQLHSIVKVDFQLQASLISEAGDAVVESRIVGFAEVAVVAIVAAVAVVGGVVVVDVAAAEVMIANRAVAHAVAWKFQTKALETTVRPGSFQVAASSCWVEDFGLD